MTRKNLDKPAIVMLIGGTPKDLDDSCIALKSLENLPDMAWWRQQRPLEADTTRISHDVAPVLVFHEPNDLDQDKIERLQKCLCPNKGNDVESVITTTCRPLLFHLVNFTEFPKGFDPNSETSNWTKRSKWGYQQMCRFWITTLWSHEAIENYTTVLRLDSDACYTKALDGYMPNGHVKLPGLVNEQTVYWSYLILSKADSSFIIAGLWNLTTMYMEQRQLQPANPRLWRILKRMNDKNLVPTFQTHFEVNRKSFMQRPDVQEWTRTVTELEPFGVFRERWGDAPVRFITMALFAPDETLVFGKPYKYQHKCQRAGYTKPNTLKEKWIQKREELVYHLSRLWNW